MQVKVLGCGEAFDERYPNTSLLLRTGTWTVLFDCGYSVPPRVWMEAVDADEIDTVYISHAHADHYFGLPALFGRMWEDGRRKPLVVLSQPAILEQTRALMEFGYRSLSARFQYEIEYRAAEPGRTVTLGDATFDFAQTQHSVTNCAVRVRTADMKTFCYSGDGMFTKESAELFTGADLLTHEAYWFESSPVHADIGGLISMAAARGIKRLALLHVQRALRRAPDRIIEAMSRAGVETSMPDPGAVFEIG